MRRQGMSLEDIGRKYGCSRERIRQIQKLSGVDPKELHVYVTNHKQRYPIPGFVGAMKRELRNHGYRWCGQECKAWLPVEAFSVCSNACCRKCNTRKHFRRYGTRPDLVGMSQSERVKILLAERWGKKIQGNKIQEKKDTQEP
jgi:Sigma-70, region 4